MEAQDNCAQNGGHLPEPRNESENNLLDGLTSTSVMFYLGMTDKMTEGNWTWETDGTSVTWTNWMMYGAEAEPDGGEAENCAVMLSQGGREKVETGKWGDRPCTGEDVILVCEAKAGKSNWCIDMCIDQGLLNTGRDHGLLSTGR